MAGASSSVFVRVAKHAAAAVLYLPSNRRAVLSTAPYLRCSRVEVDGGSASAVGGVDPAAAQLTPGWQDSRGSKTTASSLPPPHATISAQCMRRRAEPTCVLLSTPKQGDPEALPLQGPRSLSRHGT